MSNSEIRLKRNTYFNNGIHVLVKNRYTRSFPLHTHDFFEIEIVTEGEGIQIVNGTEYNIHKGVITMLTPADFHSITVFPETPLKILNIIFDETILSDSMTEAFFKKSGICRELDGELMMKLNAAANLLFLERDSERYIRPIIEYLLALLTDIPENDESDFSPIREAILYVETHFRESPSLSQAAERACLSTVYFGNLFKKTTGQTYINYLNTRKTDCAAMLLETGLSVTEACFASGFGSLSGFLHTFKKIKGMSPDEYKKRVQIKK